MHLVVFDVDGTLVDSQHHILEAQARAFAAHGLPMPSRRRALSVVGLSLAEAFAELVGPEGPVDSLSQAYKDAWTGMRSEDGFAEVLYPQAGETIEKLSKLPDLRLGIATGKSRKGVERVIAAQGWNGIFATIQTADDHPSKPHPSMILAALGETGINHDNATMVGDTSFDIAMAASARVRPIGVAWGYHDPAALLACGATAVMEDFAELQILLDLPAGDAAGAET